MLADSTQTRWFYYHAKHPDQKEHKAFEVWLELEGRAAVQHRKCVLAEGYQPARGASVQSLQERIKGINMDGSDSRAPTRDRPG